MARGNAQTLQQAAAQTVCEVRTPNPLDAFWPFAHRLVSDCEGNFSINKKKIFLGC